MTTYFSKETVILLSAPLLLILHTYFPLYTEPHLYFLSVWFYLFFLPIAILQLLKEDLRHYGFTWKKWPFRKDVTLLVTVMVLLLLYGASLLPQFQDYYVRKMPSTGGYFFLYLFFIFGMYHFAWEFFFRGFMLFGLSKRFGMFSIVIQTVPFVLMHIGKPSLEVLISVPGGLLLGYIAYRCRSFIPVFLIHWMMSCVLKSIVFFQFY